MERVCVVAFSFGEYYRYIPYYIYTFLRAYDYVHIKVFLSEKTEECIGLQDSLILLNKYFKGRFDVYENYNKQINVQGNNLTGGNKKITRWVIPYKYVQGFDYCYIGDIDFLILSESYDFKEVHKEHMEITGLPFSNAVRSEKDKRLTGLHFIKTEEYYRVMKNVIESLDNNYDQLLLDKFSDEQVLYELCHRGFDLSMLSKADPLRPYHGVHLRLLNRLDIKWRKFHDAAVLDPFFLLPQKEELSHKLNGLFAEKIFQELIKIDYPDEILLVPTIYSFKFKPLSKQIQRKRIRRSYRIVNKRVINFVKNGISHIKS